ncbi:MAG TPA: hypothetical protein VJB37_01905 [Patescibacteria group bacterium]|nr:hypothetical protein [Patescibacteria group bacterium]
MFTKKDYRNFFLQLYEVEITMKNGGRRLIKLVPDQKSKKLLKKLIADEIRHAKIVKEMMKLI